MDAGVTARRRGPNLEVNKTTWVLGFMQRDRFSIQGQRLLDFYTQMAAEGYSRASGDHITDAFSDFELRKFRNIAKTFFEQNKIQTVLDYGSGGSDWNIEGFDSESGESAKRYFNLEHVINYEPARQRDGVSTADCVTCIDVMEHIFLSDIPAVLNDIFSHANKAVMLNIACYPAAALLPNGDNAHISVRDPLWWKGVLDMVSIEFPDINVMLICSVTYQSGIVFAPWGAGDWLANESLIVPPPQGVSFGDAPVR